ncbi:MAG: 23S rRNA (pseudouridine(1915)-N(3))-methyltransferase RlmH [Lachnospiraceae bacterium]|nr:23S rRNA (pseudouridine(1915)-N(3))-methyltransferase RlmH [Lachnospiraceae bacterium]
MNYTIYIQEKKIESFFMDNIKEFTKRLSRYCKIQLIQLKKPQEITKIKLKPGKHFVIVEDQESVSSEKFAGMIKQMELHGVSNCNFYINCRPEIDNIEQFSISAFTIDPGLIAAILCEQIYRGYRINLGQPYHK